jgi:lipoprotein Spr
MFTFFEKIFIANALFCGSFMKITPITILIATGALFASCKSVQKITAKDGSTAKTQAKKPATQKKDVKFIDGIEVTPGSVVTSKHITASTKHETITYKKPDGDFKPGSIEHASSLQFKYAIMLDATVEKLDNLLLLQLMEEWWGTKYCLGGSTKSCIDCSAFTQTIMKEVYKVQIPRTAQEQYDASERIENDDLKEGDLVFFHTGNRRSKQITHVGIYLTNNKFINASTSLGVTISDLNDAYWKQSFKAGGRCLRINK